MTVILVVIGRNFNKSISKMSEVSLHWEQKSHELVSLPSCLPAMGVDATGVDKALVKIPVAPTFFRGGSSLRRIACTPQAGIEHQTCSTPVTSGPAH